jgi:hypothetical protein
LEWIAYYNVEPFGHDVGFNLVAVVASMFANVYKKKGARDTKPSDFYAQKVLRRKQSSEELKTALMELATRSAPKKKKVLKGRGKKNV